MGDFLAAMKVDAEGSRQEPGCLRFDVMQDKANPRRFFFYEVTESARAHSYILS